MTPNVRRMSWFQTEVKFFRPAERPTSTGLIDVCGSRQTPAISHVFAWITDARCTGSCSKRAIGVVAAMAAHALLLLMSCSSHHLDPNMKPQHRDQSQRRQPSSGRRHRRHLHRYRGLRRPDRQADLRQGAVDAAAAGRGHQCRRWRRRAATTAPPGCFCTAPPSPSTPSWSAPAPGPRC